MKPIITSLLVVSVVVLTSFGQLKSIDEVVGAIRSGNATELSKYFDDNVEVTLPVKSDSYSKAQAQMILKDFFANNDVKGFELKHQGDSPGGHYCIGTLQTKSGNFRAHIFMKSKGNKELIKELRFQSIE
jgi:glycosylphosphatidylinositol transamidase (GPIT) subunit GPI8